MVVVDDERIETREIGLCPPRKLRQRGQLEGQVRAGFGLHAHHWRKAGPASNTVDAQQSSRKVSHRLYVYVDYKKGTTTGISAYDQAATFRGMVDTDASADEAGTGVANSNLPALPNALSAAVMNAKASPLFGSNARTACARSRTPTQSRIETASSTSLRRRSICP